MYVNSWPVRDLVPTGDLKYGLLGSVANTCDNWGLLIDMT